MGEEEGRWRNIREEGRRGQHGDLTRHNAAFCAIRVVYHKHTHTHTPGYGALCVPSDPQLHPARPTGAAACVCMCATVCCECVCVSVFVGVRVRMFVSVTVCARVGVGVRVRVQQEHH